MSPLAQGLAILVAAWVGASGLFLLAGRARLRRRRERGDGAGER